MAGCSCHCLLSPFTGIGLSRDVPIMVTNLNLHFLIIHYWRKKYFLKILIERPMEKAVAWMACHWEVQLKVDLSICEKKNLDGGVPLLLTSTPPPIVLCRARLLASSSDDSVLVQICSCHPRGDLWAVKLLRRAWSWRRSWGWGAPKMANVFWWPLCRLFLRDVLCPHSWVCP